jgi:hypothetical protein
MAAGLSVGLVRDAPPAGELIDRIMRDARAIVDERLGGMRGIPERHAAAARA